MQKGKNLKVGRPVFPRLGHGMPDRIVLWHNPPYDADDAMNRLMIINSDHLILL